MHAAQDSRPLSFLRDSQDVTRQPTPTVGPGGGGGGDGPGLDSPPSSGQVWMADRVRSSRWRCGPWELGRAPPEGGAETSKRRQRQGVGTHRPTRAQTHVHMCTCTHTHMHTDTCAPAHTTHVHIHVHMHTLHTYTHVCMCTHTTHMHTDTCICAHVHAHTGGGTREAWGGKRGFWVCKCPMAGSCTRHMGRRELDVCEQLSKTRALPPSEGRWRGELGTELDTLEEPFQPGSAWGLQSCPPQTGAMGEAPPAALPSRLGRRPSAAACS